MSHILHSRSTAHTKKKCIPGISCSFPCPLIHSLCSGSNPSLYLFLYLCSCLYTPYFLYIKYLLKWVKLVLLCIWKNRHSVGYWCSGQLLPLPISHFWPLLLAPALHVHGLMGMFSWMISCYMLSFFFQTPGNHGCINSKKNNNDNIDNDYFPSCTYSPFSSFYSSSLHFFSNGISKNMSTCKLDDCYFWGIKDYEKKISLLPVQKLYSHKSNLI